MGREAAEEFADAVADGIEGAFTCLAEQGLELGEDLFDWVEVRAVRWEEEQLGAGGADGTAHGLALVAAKIIHDDKVAGLERGGEELLDIGGEAPAVDRAVEQAWRVDPIAAQRREEGHGFPMTMWRLAPHSLSPGCPAMGAYHIGLGPGLVDEDEPLSRDPALIALPARPPARHVAPVLLGWQQRFF